MSLIFEDIGAEQVIIIIIIIIIIITTTTTTTVYLADLYGTRTYCRKTGTGVKIMSYKH